MIASCPANIARDQDEGASLPFSAMPTLKGLVRNVAEIVWKGGSKNYHEIGAARFERFGPVYKESIFGELLVHLNDPVDIEKVFRRTGKIINRGPTLFPIVQYNRRAGYKDGLPGDGQSWYEHRSSVSKKLLQPFEVKSFVEQLIDVADESIEVFLEPSDVDPRIHHLAIDDIMKWALESIGTVLFGFRLGGIMLPPNDQVLEVLSSIKTNLKMHGKLIILYPFYKTFDTPTWRTYSRSLNKIQKHTVSFIEKAVKQQGSTSPHVHAPSILDHLLDTKTLPPREIEQNLVYIFFSGIDTTAVTVFWLLYLLSKNPDVQHKLHAEIQSVLKSGRPSADRFAQMPYLKACVKETLRHYPVTVGTTRILNKPVTVGGYEVPAGVVFYLWNFAHRKQEKLFYDSEAFKPERWLRNNENPVHDFASLPFGFGPRACTGKRIAESEIYVFMSRLLQKYEVLSSNPEHLHTTYNWFLFPNQKCKIQLKERKL